MSDLKQEAEDFFVALYRGKHRLHGPIRHDGDTTWSVSHYTSDLGISTFDDDVLSRLVFLAHERGWRASVLPSRPRYLRIQITKRERGNSIATCHPTLSDAVSKFQLGDETSWGWILGARRRATEGT